MKSYNNNFPLDYYKELEKREIEIYNEMYFDDGKTKSISSIDLEKILSRKPIIFEDYDYNLPQNIFIITSYKGKKIFQRRLFKYYKNNKYVSEEELEWENRFVTIDDFKALTKKVGLKIEEIYGNCNLESYNLDSEDVFIKVRR